jgi:hypothetical protein
MRRVLENVSHDTGLRCPGCAAYYGNLAEIVSQGGHLVHVGLKLEATCRCGYRWGVNSAWRKREIRTIANNGKTKNGKSQ